MQIVIERPSAKVLPFTGRANHPNRLTVIDRIQALEWDAGHASPARARLEIHDRQRDDAPEVGDFIAIYRANDRWAVWGAARKGAVITVWHGPSSTDLGSFGSMKEALAAICANSIKPLAVRRN